MQPHSFKFPKRAQRTFVKYLFAFAFFIFSSVIFTLAGYAHTCGPSVLEMKVGETTTWQITADLTEEETLYTPLNTGDPMLQRYHQIRHSLPTTVYLRLLP
ncbi:MAG: wall-associated protein [Candidatus Brocadia sinica]|nr:MAG: wall-associated protein [Candidatus Brocadia sinica]MCK6469636.1 hypothetical protein [Candidatus Brocadia sinica]NUO06997.1 hypothetical protein [Candidatus Brocadia sinica]